MQLKPPCGIVLGDAIAVIFVPLSVTISIFFFLVVKATVPKALWN